MHKTIRSRLTLAGFVTAISLLASGCAGAPSGAGKIDNESDATDCYTGTPLGDSMAELYDAATDAGKTAVTVYGPGAMNWKPLVEGFNECFPEIRINLVNLLGPETITRIQSEFSSGQRTGDIVFGTINNGVFLPDHAEWFEPFQPIGGEVLVHHPEDLWYAPYAGLFGIAYNSNSIEPSDVPRSWDDLLDPRWKGKISNNDLSSHNASSQTLVFAYLDDRIDDDWMTAYAAQEATVLADAAAVGKSIVTGEKDIALYAMSLVKTDKVKGAPIEFIPELSIFGHVPAGLLKDAPNPDAGKLLLSWLLTERAQEDFAHQGQYGLMPDAPLPDGFTPDNHAINEPAGSEETVEVTQHILEFWSEHQK